MRRIHNFSLLPPLHLCWNFTHFKVRIICFVYPVPTTKLDTLKRYCSTNVTSAWLRHFASRKSVNASTCLVLKWSIPASKSTFAKVKGIREKDATASCCCSGATHATLVSKQLPLCAPLSPGLHVSQELWASREDRRGHKGVTVEKGGFAIQILLGSSCYFSQ